MERGHEDSFPTSTVQEGSAEEHLEIPRSRAVRLPVSILLQEFISPQRIGEGGCVPTLLSGLRCSIEASHGDRVGDCLVSHRDRKAVSTGDVSSKD